MWWPEYTWPKPTSTNVFAWYKVVDLIIMLKYPMKIVLHPHDYHHLIDRLTPESRELENKNKYIPIRGVKVMCGKYRRAVVDLSKSPRDWGP